MTTRPDVSQQTFSENVAEGVLAARPDELRGLLDAAGFDGLVIHGPTKTLRLPPPQTFLWQYLHSTPIAGALAQGDRGTRAALDAEVARRCEPFVRNRTLISR